MSIELFAAGYCYDSGSIHQRSAAAVVMRYIDDEDRESIRVIAHPTGAATKNLAEISAARLALASVKRKFRKQEEVVLHLSSQCAGYVTEVEQGKYKKDSKKYDEDLIELRRWANYYENLRVGVLDKSDDALKAMSEAKSSADNQKPKDTKTQKV